MTLYLTRRYRSSIVILRKESDRGGNETQTMQEAKETSYSETN